MPHINEIGDIPLHRNAPYAVTNISTSQMSPCRYYGAMRYRGHDYVYDPITDVMWRWDVVRWWAKQRRQDTRNTHSAVPTLPDKENATLDLF